MKLCLNREVTQDMSLFSLKLHINQVLAILAHCFLQQPTHCMLKQPLTGVLVYRQIGSCEQIQGQAMTEQMTWKKSSANNSWFKKKFVKWLLANFQQLSHYLTVFLQSHQKTMNRNTVYFSFQWTRYRTTPWPRHGWFSKSTSRLPNKSLPAGFLY